MATIEENVTSLRAALAGGNGAGEKVTLLAATKTRTPEEIARAIAAGIADIGENKAQEFRDKFSLVQGARRHFIGHLQLNKVKYIVGRCDLLHSVDRDELADAVARRARSLGTVQDILVEVNIGGEESKSGYAPEAAREAFLRLRGLEGLRPRGLMAMLPESDDEALLSALADRMRELYEALKREDGNVDTLSMGMSGDWQLCVAHGSNLVRLGTAIFGAREIAR